MVAFSGGALVHKLAGDDIEFHYTALLEYCVVLRLAALCFRIMSSVELESSVLHYTAL